MKLRKTIFDISDLETCVDQAISNFDGNKKQSLLYEAHEALKGAFLTVIHDELDANRFENLVKWYLDKCGAYTAVISPAFDKKTSEADVDVVACFEQLKVNIHVQCKFHKYNYTDEWAVKQILAYAKDIGENNLGEPDGSSNVFWVVSTAKFSQNAIDFAQQSDIPVSLIDGEAFINMLLDVGFRGIDDVLL
jgi:predicted helicase